MDGLGWWLGYVGRLCRDYGWTVEHVMDEVPCIQGWALVAYAMENDAGLVLERTGLGYIGQELRSRRKREGAAPAMKEDGL